MCKIMGMIGVNDSNRNDAMNILKTIQPKLNSGNPHAFGYAAIDAKGSIAYEKWTDVSKVFTKQNKQLDSKLTKLLPVELIDVPSFHESKGDTSLRFTGLVAHARYATTGSKTLENTHPFVRGNTALIHNGIIYNHEKFKKHVSQCDSESILTQYIDHDIKRTPQDINKAISPLSGYMGTMVLSSVNGVSYLDLIVDDASLHVTLLDNGILLFSTNASDILSTLSSLNLKHSSVTAVYSGYHARFNCSTKDVLSFNEVEMKQYTKDQSYYDSKNIKSSNVVPAIFNDIDEDEISLEELSAWEEKYQDAEDLFEMKSYYQASNSIVKSIKAGGVK